MKKKLLNILSATIIWLCKSLQNDGKVSKEEVTELVMTLKDIKNQTNYDKSK